MPYAKVMSMEVDGVQVVYAEDIFLNNGAITVLLLYTSGWAAHRRIGWGRMLLGGAAGGAWSLCAIAFWPVLANPLMLLPLSAALVFLALNPRNGREWLRMWGAFFAASFALGGAMLALICLGRQGDSDITLSGLPVWVETFSILSFVALMRLLSGLRYHLDLRRVRIRIHLHNRTRCVWAVTDTGNQLVEPISGWPVLAVSLAAIAPMLTPRELKAVRGGGGGEGLRMIPYYAFGGANGLLSGIRPDWIEAGGRKVQQIYLAPCPDGFLKAEALINPGALEGVMKVREKRCQA